MTIDFPSIIISRVVILKDGAYVYNQKFNEGINIIRGVNGTGKSTLMDFIYFALGGELKDWTTEALSCSEIIIEVQIKGAPACLKREVSETGQSPTFFFDGPYKKARKNSESWFKYGFRRSQKKQSFSEMLFDLLGLPQHKTEDLSNLTVHQLLRAMYIDQATPSSKILKQDNQYDSAIIRQAIGEFVLGVDALDSHRIRQELRLAEKAFDKVDGELKAIYKVLSQAGAPITKKEILLKKQEQEGLLNSLQKEKTQLKELSQSDLDEKSKSHINHLNSKLLKEIDKLKIIQNEHSMLRNEILDIKLFLESLKFRIKTLQESKITSESLGNIHFKFCPCCLSELDPKSHEQNQCELCKTSKKSSGQQENHLQILTELQFQFRESSSVVDNYSKRAEEIKRELPVINRKISLIQDEIREQLSYSDQYIRQLNKISKQIGYINSQLDTLTEQLNLADQIEILQINKRDLNNQISELKEALEIQSSQNKNRSVTVYSSLEETTLDIVHSDLGYETAFDNATEFSFNFSRDKMYLDGRSKFSASSEVILKNAFRLALFIKSTIDKKYRLPRLLLVDNVEDKGMVPERSHNFQKIIVDYCENTKLPSQIIFTTSMINPELNDSSYCVGPFYTKGMHTLDI